MPWSSSCQFMPYKPKMIFVHIDFDRNSTMKISYIKYLAISDFLLWIHSSFGSGNKFVAILMLTKICTYFCDSHEPRCKDIHCICSDAV